MHTAANTDATHSYELEQMTSGDTLLHCGCAIDILSTPEWDERGRRWIGAGRLTDLRGRAHDVMVWQDTGGRLYVRGWR